MSNATLRILVKPGRDHPQLLCTENGYEIHVRERAVDGAANAAVIRALANILDTPPSRLSITHGAGSRMKTLHIDGLDESAVHERLTTSQILTKSKRRNFE